MRTKAYIFDLDGTLYNKRLLKLRIIAAELRAGYFRYLLRERSARVVMRGNNYGTEEEFYRHFFHNISSHHPDRAEHWYREHYLPLQAEILRCHYHVDSWVTPRLEELKREGIECVVYSDYGYAREKMEAIGLDTAYFSHVFDAPSLGGLKPSRESSLRLLEAIGVRPEEAVFVGDRVECDVAAARRIGARYEFFFRKGRDVFFTSQISDDSHAL